MSVKYVVLAVLATACRDKAAPPKPVAATIEAAAAPLDKVAQATTPAPTLPPVPPEQRAEVMFAAPPAAQLLPACDDVKLRVYVDGIRRSCMTATEGTPRKSARTLIACGARAELPAEKPLAVELRYERRGQQLAKLELGEVTLDVGQQTLVAQGAVTYGEVDRLCAGR